MAPRSSCRNAKVGDLVTEPAIREIYRSGLFTVKAACADEGDVVELLCLDCGQRFEPQQGLAVGDRLPDAVGRGTLADHAYTVPRHRVVARCSCGALEVR